MTTEATPTPAIEATLAATRVLLAAATDELAEATLDRAASSVAKDDTRQARALDSTAATRSAFDKASKFLTRAQDRELDGEARVRALSRGLARAEAGEKASTLAKWQRVAEAQRRQTAQDQAQTVKVLEAALASVDAEQARLVERKSEVDRLALQAATQGAGLRGVSPARLLDADYHAFRNIRTNLADLASMRRS